MSDLQTPSGHPVRNPRSAHVWSLARADYLAGAGAPEVCERHGLSLSTFRWRARKEGWRRADQAETPCDAPFTDPVSGAPDRAQAGAGAGSGPLPLDVLRPDESWDAMVELSDIVWLHLQRAIRAGRLIEARGWARVHRDLIGGAEGPVDRAANAPLRQLMQQKIDEAAAQLAAFEFPPLPARSPARQRDDDDDGD